jgi:hypothetical protein
MPIPALDKTGKMYEVSRMAMGADVYYLMLSYSHIESMGGVEFTDYLTARLFKNEDRSNSLFSSDVGGKIQMALNNIGNHPQTFTQRWNSFVARLSKAIDDLNITTEGSPMTDMQLAWDTGFETLALCERDGKLGLVDAVISEDSGD